MLKDDRTKGLAALFGAIILGGAMSPLIKVGLKEVNPETFSFLRFLISGILLFPLLIKSGIKLDRNLIKLFCVSLLGTANILLFAFGIRLTSASVGQTLYILSPIIIALLSYFLLKEKLGNRKVLGIALGSVGGLLLIVFPILEKTTSLGSIEGNLLIALAVFSFSLYSYFSKKLQSNYSPIQITMAFSVTTVVLLLLPVIGGFNQNFSLVTHASLETILSILYVGAIGTAIYYVLYQYGLKHAGLTTSSTLLFYLQPLTTIFYSYFLLAEFPTAGFAVGALVTAAGAWLVMRSKN